MTHHDNDDDVRRLREAEAERDAALRQGVEIAPLVTRLRRHAMDDRFAELLVDALVEHRTRRSP